MDAGYIPHNTPELGGLDNFYVPEALGPRGPVHYNVPIPGTTVAGGVVMPDTVRTGGVVIPGTLSIGGRQGVPVPGTRNIGGAIAPGTTSTGGVVVPSQANVANKYASVGGMIGMVSLIPLAVFVGFLAWRIALNKKIMKKEKPSIISYIFHWDLWPIWGMKYSG